MDKKLKNTQKRYEREINIFNKIRSCKNKIICNYNIGNMKSFINSNYNNYIYMTHNLEAKMNEKGKIKKKLLDLPKQWNKISNKIFNNDHNAISLLCGETNGIYCIDYDNEKNFLDDCILFENELKNNYEKTRQGFHCFFKYDLNSAKIGTHKCHNFGIDFLGNNSFVIVAPTQYTDGCHIYEYKKITNNNLNSISNNLLNHLLSKYINLKENKKSELSQSKLNECLNKIFETNYDWILSKNNEDIKITHNSYKCLIKKNHKHDKINHSCIFINNFKFIASCFSHGIKNKLNMRNNKDILEELFKLLNFKLKKDKVDKKIIRTRKLTNKIRIMDVVLKDSKKNKYLKDEFYIYKPYVDDNDNNILSYYERFLTHEEYLNELFFERNKYTYSEEENDYINEFDLYDIYRQISLKPIFEHLKGINDIELQFIKLNKYIISFKNGFLNIQNMEFKKFNNINNWKINENINNVFINENFKEELLTTDVKHIDTPFYDRLIKHHIVDEEIYNIFNACVGRLFFNVYEKDKWKCMMFILGDSNTGKSTIINIISSFFNSYDIGSLSNDGIYSLDGCQNKKIIINSDIPENLSEYLNRSVYQNMVSNEHVMISVKNGKQESIPNWTVPMIMAGNYMISYNDKSSSITNRTITFLMTKEVIDKDSLII